MRGEGILSGLIWPAQAKAKREMLFGHNTNVTVGGTAYHIQTEDRGVSHALIDTTVYFRGRVLHRRTNNYFDLLPLDTDREQALKLRLDEQHRNVVEDIRSGTLHLALPQEDKAAPSKSLLLELSNSKTWLSGKRAALHVSVRNQDSGTPVENARVAARIDGAAEAHEFTAQTASDGRVHLEFDMPRLAGADVALVIEATNGNAKAHLRFSLRAKPRATSKS
jgi:hypothetical protein